jgi:hypothetical protein
MRTVKLSFLAFLAVVLSACESIPKDVLKAQSPTIETRRVQSRRFDSKDEKKVLMACGNLLQDLGFNITESDAGSGLIVGHKDRSAVEARQVAAKVLVASLFLGTNIAIDKNQKMKASIVTRPANKNSIGVRVTFQRLVYDDQNRLSKAEALSNPLHYQEFFEKLSKSLFLNAHNLE